MTARNKVERKSAVEGREKQYVEQRKMRLDPISLFEFRKSMQGMMRQLRGMAL